MRVILTTMLKSLFRDMHTLVWNIVFPVAMLMGLGLYFNDSDYSYRLLGGVLTTNVLFGATIVTAFYVMAQRNRGIYKLLRATPFSTVAFIAATTGSRTVLTLLVSACVIAIGTISFGIKIGFAALGLILLVLLLGTVCFTALGFLAANLSRDEGNVNMISNLMSFPMLLTSEAFYSLERAPQWVAIVGRMQPFHYLVEAMSVAIRPQDGLSAIWMPLGMLAGFTIVCLGAAAATFRWDAEATAAGWKKMAGRKTASS
ncbi:MULTISPECIES: ABC transporter permease [Cohnella]|uniref:ABC transporter permease n=1 Tax=Cohnella TaxID=329857 RepID=UPI0009BA0BB4|nr:MULTISPECIES: ABC transporter permease [Cohnella]MBN2980936.1 ABC transporter permease [Cohnella algarum]